MNLKPMLAVTTALWLSACSDSSSTSDFSDTIRFATYHADMEFSDYNQALSETGSGNEPRLQNVAEVIQRARPDVLLVTGFSGADGLGGEEYRKRALELFVSEYLNQAQDPDLDAVSYPYLYLANSNSGIPVLDDLNKDGSAPGTLPFDAKGYGHYAGEKSFALLSRYALDENNVRTYRQLEWKRVPTADGQQKPQDGSGNDWFASETWNSLPLMDTNFVDIPMKLPDGRIVQLLATYLGEPAEVDASNRAYMRNRAQVEFVADYISQDYNSYIVNDDDNSRRVTGGYDSSRPFVLMGNFYNDHEGAWALGADGAPSYRADSAAMRTLVNSSTLHRFTGVNWEAPTSAAGVDYAQTTASTHSMPGIITGLNALRNDYIMLEQQLKFVDQGIVWAQLGDDGEALFYRNNGQGQMVNDPQASSSHRLVWMDVSFSQ
ncbi:Endonuclease/Exonuclease/phosphatase family protein [Ferrimonas sediminum]|uniref:Endonuclease/Exonuclease/phosphatase family protein n=1 Tax=Ferrimonas sediminum TaxID=718193 RepID=A0A1G8ZH04_9GAMM|nr:endonuclease/exonuclease/phosphatase family protein [Ferrimonas sediminum]SDK14283.1 Endonuclease/Exonuclease/phosphatase family protein [Ferrimonas sediminum]